MPWVVAAPAAAVSGVALDAAFPGVGAWPLALVAPALALLVVRGRSAAGGYGLGVLFGVGFMVPHLQWSGIFVGPLPWLSLAVLEALLLGLAGAMWPACWRLAQRPGLLWTLPLTAGAAWLAAEALRARVPFGGFPWGRLAFSQADSPLVRVGALVGAPGVGLVVVAAAACLALTLARVLDRARTAGTRPGGPGAGREALRALAPLAAAAVALPLLVAGGVAAGDTQRPGDATVTVAAVQGDVPQAGLDFNAERRAVTDNHARVTEELAGAVAAGEVAPPDVVIWPENASDIDPLRNEDAAAVISRATDAVGVPVLVGAVLREPGDDLTNATLVWEPGTGYRGDAGGRYAKQEPAPFAEYIPYRAFFRRITSLVDEVPRDFVPGPGPGVLDMGPARVGPVICFEVADDEVVGGQVRAGADLLAVPTNNATFGFTDESTQQLAMTRFRAVEHGRAAVQASTVGVSAVAYPDGSLSRVTELFTPDAVVAEVPLRSGLTPAARAGQWPEVVVALGVALVVLAHVVAGAVRRVRRRGAPPGPLVGAVAAEAPVADRPGSALSSRAAGPSTGDGPDTGERGA